jgi:hypothetical protein
MGASKLEIYLIWKVYNELEYVPVQRKTRETLILKMVVVTSKE